MLLKWPNAIHWMDHNNTRNCSGGKIIRFFTKLWGKVNVSSFENTYTHTHMHTYTCTQRTSKKKRATYGQKKKKIPWIWALVLGSNLDFNTWGLPVLGFITGKTGVIFKITYRRTLCPQNLHDFLCYYIFTKPFELGAIFIILILQVRVLRQKECVICPQLGSGRTRIQEQV